MPETPGKIWRRLSCFLQFKRMDLSSTRRALAHACSSLVHDFFAQDPTDRSCGQEHRAKWFIGSEGVGNFENAGFRTLSIRLCSFVLLYALVRLPGSAIDLPCRDRNLRFFNQREGLLNRFQRTVRIALRHGHSRLQLPSERLQIRIAG